MKSTDLKVLHDQNFADNISGDISPEKLREVTDEFVDKSGGWGDYVNGNVVPQVLQSSQWTELTNDKASANTDQSFRPHFTATMFENNRVKLLGIPLGHSVTCRIALNVTTLSANTDIDVRVTFRNNADIIIFSQVIDHKSFKSAIATQYVDLYTFFVGPAIVDGTMAIEVNPDKNVNMLHSGIFITIP